MGIHHRCDGLLWKPNLCKITISQNYDIVSISHLACLFYFPSFTLKVNLRQSNAPQLELWLSPSPLFAKPFYQSEGEESIYVIQFNKSKAKPSVAWKSCLSACFLKATFLLLSSHYNLLNSHHFSKYWEILLWQICKGGIIISI